MHQRLSFLYEYCECKSCKSKKIELSLKDDTNKLLNIAKKAFKHLHKKGNYKPNDLKTEEPYKNLITEINDVFNKTLIDNVVDDKLLEVLQKDVFLFSGLKTHAQLFEASRLMLDENGKIKSFDSFAKDFNKLNTGYNQNYLAVEYDFALGTSAMAQRWAGFSEDDGYYLQYRTDGGPNVRDSHAALNNTTLPKSDPFWDSYTPKNGWNCHCMTVEVLAMRYEKSDSKDAIAKGNAATTQIGKDGKNKLEIFRFNAGKDKVIFPPNHPYNKVVGANKVKDVLTEKQKEELKVNRKLKDAEIQKWANSKIKKGQHLTITGKQFKTPEVRISKSNIENLLKHTPNVSDKDAVRDIEKIIKKSVYYDSKELENKNSKNYGSKVARGVLSYNYYRSKWNDTDVEINMEVMKDGYEQPYAILFNKK